ITSRGEPNEPGVVFVFGPAQRLASFVADGLRAASLAGKLDAFEVCARGGTKRSRHIGHSAGDYIKILCIDIEMPLLGIAGERLAILIVVRRGKRIVADEMRAW